MTSNPNCNEERTRSPTADEPPTDRSEGDESTAESSETALSRRHTLIGAGVGLGLLNGRTLAPPGEGNPGKGGRPWNRDVDAKDHNLLNLGGMTMTDMDEGELITGFDGANLEIDDESLRVTKQLDVAGINIDELTGGVSNDERIDDLVGDNLSIDDNRLNAVNHWRRKGVLLEPSDDDIDGIEVEDVESPDQENLRVESDADLVLSISGGQGAVRIETEGGHQIVLDDADGAQSLSVEDSAGNSVEMDATTGEVSVSATEKITLDAPEIDLLADETVNIESKSSMNIKSDNIASLGSSGLVNIDGSLLTLNGGGGARPAARVDDSVVDGEIVTGSPSVLIG